MDFPFPRYVAFDPGKSVGYAYFDAEGNATGHGQVSFEQLLDILNMLASFYPIQEVDLTVIVEDFQLQEHKARDMARNSHSRGMEVSQALGAIKLFAKVVKAELVVHRPEFGTKIAKSWTGLDPNKDHANSNWKSAFNHGVYHLVRTVEICDYKNPPIPKSH